MSSSSFRSASAAGFLVAAVVASGSAAAAPTVFFGEDPGANLTVPSNGASVAAKATFLASLAGSSIRSEGFESYTPQTSGPLTSLFSTPGDTLTLVSGGSGRIENRVSIGNAVPGRFNTTVGGSQWWQSSSSFTITFAKQTSAFGFYGTDFGDLGGGLSLELLSGNTVVQTLLVKNAPVTTGNPAELPPPSVPQNGSLLFFGFADSTRGYDAVRFAIRQGPVNVDVLGFDDLLIGDLPPIGLPGTVPEPASLALVGISLAALVASRRKAGR